MHHVRATSSTRSEVKAMKHWLRAFLPILEVVFVTHKCSHYNSGNYALCIGKGEGGYILLHLPEWAIVMSRIRVSLKPLPSSYETAIMELQLF